MNPIQQVNPAQAQPATSINTAGKSSEIGKPFKEVLSDLLDQYNQVQNSYMKSVEDLVMNKTDNLAEVASAAQKAEIATKLLIQLRNKIVDAYEEIMRMRI